MSGAILVLLDVLACFGQMESASATQFFVKCHEYTPLYPDESCMSQKGNQLVVAALSFHKLLTIVNLVELQHVIRF